MTKEEMVQRVRDYIDDTDLISADNFTTLRIQREVFEGVQKATGLLKNLDDTYLRQEVTQTVTGTTVDLPDDFDVLIAYSKIEGDNVIPFKIRELREERRNQFPNFGLGDTEVELTPTQLRYTKDIGSHTSRLTYIKRIADVDAVTTSYNLPPEVERLAVLLAAKNILVSENAKNIDGIKSLCDEARFDLNTLIPVSKQQPRYVRYVS